MPDLTSLLGFALVALGMVLTPGPNMIYLISRSLCQGKRAGYISLAGVGLAFIFYMLSAAFGITALFLLFLMPMMLCVLRGHCICSGWRGSRSNRADALHFRCGIYRKISRKNCSPWGF